jgi:small subunit ribosomal protein S8
MSMTDPIADLLTRIRNANQKAFEKLEVPHSKFKEEIVRILKDEGYLKDYRILKDQGRSLLKISMKYGDREKRIITRIERVSRSSKRVYVGHDEIPRVQGGIGVAILSTPGGVMTDRQARARASAAKSSPTSGSRRARERERCRESGRRSWPSRRGWRSSCAGEHLEVKGRRASCARGAPGGEDRDHGRVLTVVKVREEKGDDAVHGLMRASART